MEAVGQRESQYDHLQGRADLHAIDGKKVAADIRSELKDKISQLKAEGKNVPGLVAIIVALATISFQAIKAAIANPVKSLRTE